MDLLTGDGSDMAGLSVREDDMEMEVDKISLQKAKIVDGAVTSEGKAEVIERGKPFSVSVKQGDILALFNEYENSLSAIELEIIRKTPAIRGTHVSITQHLTHCPNDAKCDIAESSLTPIDECEDK